MQEKEEFSSTRDVEAGGGHAQLVRVDHLAPLVVIDCER